MNNYKLITKIIELAKTCNIDIYIPSIAFINEILIKKNFKNLNKVEIGVILKEESSLENYLNLLKENNFIFLFNRNKIKIFLEKNEFEIYFYREIDDKFYAIVASSSTTIKFLLSGAEISKSNKLNFKIIYYKIFRIIRIILKIFLSDKKINQILNLELLVDFVEKKELDYVCSEKNNYKFKIKKESKNNKFLLQNDNDKIIKINRDDLVNFKLNLNDLLYSTEVIYDVFKEKNIELYLSAGTLLGAIRNKNFIPWDYDIDLASKEKYLIYSNEIAKELIKKGFSVYYTDISNVMAVFYKGISIDIDFYREEEGSLTMPMKNFDNIIGKFIYYFDWLVNFKPISSTIINYKNDVWMAPLRDFLSILLSFISRKNKLIIIKVLNKLATVFKNSRGAVVIPENLVGETGDLKIFNRNWKVPSSYDDYLTLYYGEWRIEKKIFNYFDENAKPISKTQVNGKIWDFK